LANLSKKGLKIVKKHLYETASIWSFDQKVKFEPTKTAKYAPRCGRGANPEKLHNNPEWRCIIFLLHRKPARTTQQRNGALLQHQNWTHSLFFATECESDQKT